MADDPKPGEQTPPPAVPPAVPPATPPPAVPPPTPPIIEPSKAGDPPPPPAPPEPPASYELTVPDDAKAIATPLFLDELKALARANKWSNEDAQASLTESIALNQRLVAKQQAVAMATAQADPDYGGAKLGETQRLANVVIDAIRPEGHARRAAFKTIIQTAGNNIEVLAFLADLGSRLKEDAPRHGQPGGGGAPVDAAAKLYDHATSKT